LIIDESLDDLVLVKAAQAGELDAENALLMAQTEIHSRR
jgi:hypothetical protein